MNKQKLYLLDTNVLVYDPNSLFSFADAYVGIPIVVLEELDKFKIESTERGASAREVIRRLDQLRQRGSLKDGVPLDNGGRLEVLFVQEPIPVLLPGDIDNQILMTAMALKKQGYDVQFVTKDLNARVKADVLGIAAQDYLKDNVSSEQFYRGWRHVIVPSIELKRQIPEALATLEQEHELIINEFILLQARNSPAHYRIYRYLGDTRFKEVVPPQLRWPLEPRNPQQLMALDLLLDPAIQLVTLIGPAGTGKTFLALLAGLQQVLVEEEYGKMLISRPVIPLGPDIGYLPGTIQEKLHSWMQPMYDNMDFITHSANNARRALQYEEDRPRHHRRKHDRGKYDQRPRQFLSSLDQLIQEGKISLEAITYMRGRSIPFQYILIDEVQNLTPHEVKTLISRVGEGSKIVLLGDPFQIDALYLDFSSNGLVVATSKFRGVSGTAIFGTVFLHSSERSDLSKLVNELM
jgi:PhoH-like ATPase